MRIATLIVGLVFSLWLMAEEWIGNILTSMGNSEEARNAAGLGFFAGFVALFASALVVAFPLASMFIYVIAGLFSLGAASGGYGNHEVFNVVLFLLAIASFFGWRGKKKERREANMERQRQLERDNRMETLMRQQAQYAEAQASRPCPSCGRTNPPDTRFCGGCGYPLTGTAQA